MPPGQILCFHKSILKLDHSFDVHFLIGICSV